MSVKSQQLEVVLAILKGDEFLFYLPGLEKVLASNA